MSLRKMALSEEIEEDAEETGSAIAEASNGTVKRRVSVNSADGSARESLPALRILAYGFGHVFNDLCASLWFMYLVIYLQHVQMFSPQVVGYLMLLGQAVDGIATPLVGFLSDKIKLPRFLIVYGRRKTFHLIGTLCVLISFPLVFGPCRLCNESTSEIMKALYYCPPIVIFQIGWAIVQISHLALIPELAMCEQSRTTLNSVRYGFTVMAQMTVFCMIFFMLMKGKEATKKVSTKDVTNFQDIDLLVVCIGCYFSAAFHFGIKESRNARRLISESMSYTVEGPPSPQHPVSRDLRDPTLPKMYWKDWFREHQFYQVALLYMLSRLYINISQIYLSFYIEYSQGWSKEYVGLFPMIICFTSFIVSSIMSFRKINQYLNRKLSYVVGVLFGVSACGWMWVQDMGMQIIAVLVLLGIAQSVLLVTSLAFTADLIDKNSESGAFVYGAMSFVDKIANGATCMVIQAVKPLCHVVEGHHTSCSIFYRDVMVFVPGAALVLAAALLLSLLPQHIGIRRAQSSSRTILVNEEQE